MSAIAIDAIKELRRLTCASIAHCKEALKEAKGDVEKAAKILRRKGLEIASQKAGRAAKEGRIDAYIHTGNKIGVLLEVDCESDFAAKNEEFIKFTKDLAMQIAAASPTYISKEEVPKQEIAGEKDKEAFYKQHCLMEQPFVKDPGITISDYFSSLVAKLGEKIVLRRFTRYKIGE